LGGAELLVLADGATENFDVSHKGAIDFEVNLDFYEFDATDWAEQGACF
jgi:hypothetical protein